MAKIFHREIASLPLRIALGFAVVVVVQAGIIVMHDGFGWFPERWLASRMMISPSVTLAIGFAIFSVLLWVALDYIFYRRRADNLKSVASPQPATVPEKSHSAIKYPRGLTIEERTALIDKLESIANEHTNVKITFLPAQFHPFVKLLDGAFLAAGWDTNTNLTPQEHFVHRYEGGVQVRGFNSHLVDGVTAALRDVGIVDAFPAVEKLEVPRDNPKWPTSINKIYLRIGHIEDPAR